MTGTESSTVIAVFDQRAQAESAIDDLWHAGFRHDQIGIASPGQPVTEAQTPTGAREDTAAKGAATGAVTGGAVGAIAGTLVLTMVPGIGTVLAGGLLAGILGSTAAGAAVGSYLGPFVAMGFSEDQARQYHRELKAGRTLVAVQAGDRQAEAITILHSHGGRNASPAETTAARV